MSENNIINLKDFSNGFGLEHPSVQKVIKIAENIVSQNKTLDVETLYNRAKRILQIPRKGLLRIIQMLINRKILIEGSKYTRRSVLNNPLRKTLYFFIKENLGAHFSDIRKNVFTPGDQDDLGSAGQFIWHLEMLLKFKYIKKIKVKNFTVFIPIEVSDEVGELYFILRDDLNRKIVELIRNSGPLQRSDVYKNLEEKRETIYYRINNLVELDLLEIDEERGNQIRINPQKKEKMSMILKDFWQTEKNLIALSADGGLE